MIIVTKNDMICVLNDEGDAFMITTVCLNPAIDHTISVNKLINGQLNRVTTSSFEACGKGVNVALTVARLGEPVCCAAFLPEGNGVMLTERLQREGIRQAHVPTGGRIRINTKVFDESAALTTEINEGGAAVTDQEIDAMTDNLIALARDSDYLVLSGSLPPGCPSNYYEKIIRSCHDVGCRIALDADTDKLAMGIQAKPFLIKPNLTELRQLTGESLQTLSEIDETARRIAHKGIGIVVVSLGENGAYITDGLRALKADPIPVEIGSTVGAGDAMLGGLVTGFARGLDMEHAFALGVACGTNAVLGRGTGLVTAQVCNELVKRVNIHSV
ncbi:MAG: 1-phosphofructokinase family hexose kinase [Clostridia bacterium]|nr:1-phosphofructokinase family hexose kinase [Clostridia bacterium]